MGRGWVQEKLRQAEVGGALVFRKLSSADKVKKFAATKDFMRTATGAFKPELMIPFQPCLQSIQKIF